MNHCTQNGFQSMTILFRKNRKKKYFVSFVKKNKKSGKQNHAYISMCHKIFYDRFNFFSCTKFKTQKLKKKWTFSYFFMHILYEIFKNILFPFKRG